MIKSTNYKTINRIALKKLNLLICTLFYESNFKKVILKKDGNVLLIKRNFLFFRTGVKIPIYDLLLEEIPMAISMELFNSIDFAKHLRLMLIERINAIGEGKVIYKIESLIDYLHKEVELRHLISRIPDVLPIPLPVPNDHIVITTTGEHEDTHPISVKDSLFFIFKGLVEGTYKNSVRVARVYTLILALNALRILYSPVSQTLSLNAGSYWNTIVNPFKMFLNTS